MAGEWIRVFAGGTTGAQDGTQVSVDGSLSSPVSVLAAEEAVAAHVRCYPGWQTTQHVIATSQDADMLVSANGTEWASSCDLGVVGDANVPIYLRFVSARASTQTRLARCKLDYGAIEAA